MKYWFLGAWHGIEDICSIEIKKQSDYDHRHIIPKMISTCSSKSLRLKSKSNQINWLFKDKNRYHQGITITWADTPLSSYQFTTGCGKFTKITKSYLKLTIIPLDFAKLFWELTRRLSGDGTYLSRSPSTNRPR